MLQLATWLRLLKENMIWNNEQAKTTSFTYICTALKDGNSRFENSNLQKTRILHDTNILRKSWSHNSDKFTGWSLLTGFIEKEMGFCSRLALFWKLTINLIFVGQMVLNLEFKKIKRGNFLQSTKPFSSPSNLPIQNLA